MTPDRLLAHYHRIADAPDAVARLRRFVLDLAVRGKLVAQEVLDGGVSDLLERIAYDKSEKGGRGRARLLRVNSLVPTQVQYQLPETWAWVRLGDIVIPRDGERVPVSKEERNGRAKIFDYYGASGVIDKIDGYLFDKPLLLVGEDGANLINRATPIAFMARGKYWVNNHAHVLDGIEETFLRYLELFINATDLLPFITGTAQPKMNQAKMNGIPVALPPLAEQHRIVAKVDELMALCDRLEAGRVAREAARDRLAAASLARLNTPDPDPATFTPHARFALNTLPALTTRPNQIKPLRQTILNLAVRGKLVPQDPNDEPIHAAIKRATAERRALLGAKQFRHKKLQSFDVRDADASLPECWATEVLGNLVDPKNTISYGVLVPGEEVPDGVPFVRAQDLTLIGHPARPNKTISPDIESAYARTRLQGGEILLCVVGSIGKLGVVPQSWAGANIARAVARIMPIPAISKDYLLLVLQGQPVQDYFTSTTRTLAQPTLNVGLIEQTPIPLPPLAEQHRIVAKVDALLALCNRLEAALATGDDTRRRLLDALLQEALASPGAELDTAA